MLRYHYATYEEYGEALQRNSVVAEALGVSVRTVQRGTAQIRTKMMAYGINAVSRRFEPCGGGERCHRVVRGDEHVPGHRRQKSNRVNVSAILAIITLVLHMSAAAASPPPAPQAVVSSQESIPGPGPFAGTPTSCRGLTAASQASAQERPPHAASPPSAALTAEPLAPPEGAHDPYGDASCDGDRYPGDVDPDSGSDTGPQDPSIPRSGTEAAGRYFHAGLHAAMLHLGLWPNVAHHFASRADLAAQAAGVMLRLAKWGHLTAHRNPAGRVAAAVFGHYAAPGDPDQAAKLDIQALLAGTRRGTIYAMQREDDAIWQAMRAAEVADRDLAEQRRRRVREAASRLTCPPDEGSILAALAEVGL